MSTTDKISVRAYAKLLDVDEKAVRRAIGDGKIKKGFDKKAGKISPAVADREWGFIHKAPKPQRGLSAAKVAEKLDQKTVSNKSADVERPDKKNSIVPGEFNENYSYTQLIEEINIYPSLSYQEAIRRKEILTIAMDKMKIEELQGMLVKKADVEKSLFVIGDQLKKSLLNIPARCIDHILTAPNKVEANNILIMEINQVLNQFAQLTA